MDNPWGATDDAHKATAAEDVWSQPKAGLGFGAVHDDHEADISAPSWGAVQWNEPADDHATMWGSGAVDDGGWGSSTYEGINLGGSSSSVALPERSHTPSPPAVEPTQKSPSTPSFNTHEEEEPKPRSHTPNTPSHSAHNDYASHDDVPSMSDDYNKLSPFISSGFDEPSPFSEPSSFSSITSGPNTPAFSAFDHSHQVEPETSPFAQPTNLTYDDDIQRRADSPDHDGFGTFALGNTAASHDDSTAWPTSAQLHPAQDDAMSSNAWGSDTWESDAAETFTSPQAEPEDEWERAQLEQQRRNARVPPELLASLVRQTEDLVETLWPPLPHDEELEAMRRMPRSLEDVDKLTYLVSRLVPTEPLTEAPIHFAKTQTSKEVANTLKLTRNLPLTRTSPLAHFLNSKGSSAWEAAIRAQTTVRNSEDHVPMGWRVMEKKVEDPTDAMKVKTKPSGGILSKWLRRTSSVPSETTSPRPSSPAATPDSPRIKSPRLSTPRASIDLGALMNKEGDKNSGTSSLDPILAAAPIPPQSTGPDFFTTEDLTPQEAPAPSAVSRFLGRFSRQPTRNRNSLALSTDDLDMLGDITPSAADERRRSAPNSSAPEIGGLEAMIKSQPVFGGPLPPTLAPPPKAPPAASPTSARLGIGITSMGSRTTSPSVASAPSVPMLAPPMTPISPPASSTRTASPLRPMYAATLPPPVLAKPSSGMSAMATFDDFTSFSGVIGNVGEDDDTRASNTTAEDDFGDFGSFADAPVPVMIPPTFSPMTLGTLAPAPISKSMLGSLPAPPSPPSRTLPTSETALSTFSGVSGMLGAGSVHGLLGTAPNTITPTISRAANTSFSSFESLVRSSSGPSPRPYGAHTAATTDFGDEFDDFGASPILRSPSPPKVPAKTMVMPSPPSPALAMAASTNSAPAIDDDDFWGSMSSPPPIPVALPLVSKAASIAAPIAPPAPRTPKKVSATLPSSTTAWSPGSSELPRPPKDDTPIGLFNSRSSAFRSPLPPSELTLAARTPPSAPPPIAKSSHIGSVQPASTLSSNKPTTSGQPPPLLASSFRATPPISTSFSASSSAGRDRSDSKVNHDLSAGLVASAAARGGTWPAPLSPPPAALASPPGFSVPRTKEAKATDSAWGFDAEVDIMSTDALTPVIQTQTQTQTWAQQQTPKQVRALLEDDDDVPLGHLSPPRSRNTTVNNATHVSALSAPIESGMGMRQASSNLFTSTARTLSPPPSASVPIARMAILRPPPSAAAIVPALRPPPGQSSGVPRLQSSPSLDLFGSNKPVISPATAVSPVTAKPAVTEGKGLSASDLSFFEGL